MPTLADRRIIVTAGYVFPRIAVLHYVLGELRRWNAYEIVRIPRADSGSTLGRPRAYIATALTAIPGEGEGTCQYA